MEVAIIGAGFTGLSAAFSLAKLGYKVTVFEKSSSAGGLALGFKDKSWKWSLERHYHHLFTSDSEIMNLASEVGIRLVFKDVPSSTYLSNRIYPLDSASNLLALGPLDFVSRIRTGLGLSYLKITNSWKSLEAITAKDFIIHFMGKNSWSLLWEPLFVGKFGRFAKDIPASWFWARIKKRSKILGYPEGGFQKLADCLVAKTEEKGGRFYFNLGVREIRNKGGLKIVTDDGKSYKFDKIICTLPTFVFASVCKDLPESYTKNLKNLKGFGALNLIMSLKQGFLKNRCYWLNISDRSFPFVSLVEQTNFIDKKYYGGNCILYIGNYLPPDHPYFSKTEDFLVEEFLPYLKKINRDFNKSIINKVWVSKDPFAQPVIPLNYSKVIPSLETPLPNVFLANMQQVYPWDRGTNYAVELGIKVAAKVAK